jgi:hypothetical protein
LLSKHPILLAKIFNDLPETAISKNRNGSSTLCVFKTHYRDRRAAVAKHRILMQIQFSDHTSSDDSAAWRRLPIALKPWLAVLPFRGKSKTGGIRHFNLGQSLRVHHFVFLDDSALEQQVSSQGVYFVGLK